MGLYKLVVESDMLGEQDNNVHYYFNDGSYVPSALAEAFAEVVLRALIDVKVSDSEALRLRITDPINPDNPEFIANLANWVGQRGGDPATSFLTWSFYLATYGSRVRSGGKRVGGVGEDHTLGNEASPGIQVFLSTLATAYSRIISYGSSADFIPVVFSRTQDLFAPVIGSAYTKVSTMDSRKQGRGAPASATLVPDTTYDFGTFAPSETVGVKSFANWLTAGNQPFYVDVSSGNAVLTYL